MKEYFKYDSGYVNINDENLFLTNSGNWSETAAIEEKSSKTIRKNTVKGLKFYAFILVLLCLVALSVARAKSGSIPIGLILLVFAAFIYMKREVGSKYKIPLSKIKNIEINGSEVKIIFLNSNNVEDFEIIHKVENKGLSILTDLIQTLKK
ncbi:hypothetical protein [Flavobacterium sp.]|uniref:hypothetical protein n=1 Tax=Flavobacterium sp. TaxID=239 RepID=UPI003D6B491D